MAGSARSEAAEAEYEGVYANDSEGGGDILVVSDSEGNEGQVSADESIASDAKHGYRRRVNA